MRELYIECNMGISGDMLMSALSELVPDADGFIERLNAAGIPNVSVIREKAVKCGITGTHIRVFVNGEEEGEAMHEHHHHHEHGHEPELKRTLPLPSSLFPFGKTEHHHSHEHEQEHHHHHHHHHSGFNDITALIDSLNVSERVKTDAKAVYKIIAEGEGHVHGKEITDIHFHEVGTMDAVADIVGCCMLMEEIGAGKISASSVRTGFGNVSCAHGILPVPAPATAYILRGIPQYSGNIEGELCTPTGAALLKYFSKGFGTMPLMTVEKTGCGMGSKDFPVANCVRVFSGESKSDFKTDSVLEITCNLDDMTGEDLAFACERIFEAGALDVCTIPCGMKKSRQGIILLILCKEAEREAVAGSIFKHTSTIGLRIKPCERYVLERKAAEVETKFGTVKTKISKFGEIEKTKAEYSDLERIAKENNISLNEVRKNI
ncbi:MAG: nickel pincer cofactor biosynthesis protein LarC [Clostridiales bacterium]|nr:nickel pincer cofactor biosynthesis protein LarC [Clostridiales bacterium]